MSSCSLRSESRRTRSSSASAAVRPSTVERGCERFSARYRCRRPSSATYARRSRTPRVCSVLRRARRPRPCRCSSDGSPPWRSSRPTQLSPAPGRRVGSAPRSPRSAPRLVEGAPTVLDLVGFDELLLGCDLVVTGEGQVDRTTAEGKAPGEVARRCAAAGVRCVVFGGRVVEPVAGTETVSLSGDRANAEDRSRRAGRTSRSASEIQRARAGRPSTRASSRRPRVATRRTA